MNPHDLYRSWMPLVLLVSLITGTCFSLQPRWSASRDHELIALAGPPSEERSWIEFQGPAQAIVRAGAPFTSFTATVALQMPRIQETPPGTFTSGCYDLNRGIVAADVADGEVTNPLPKSLACCDIIPKRIHWFALLGNILFASGIVAVFGWSLLLAASRRVPPPPGQCACGYDVSGLSRCPECGADVQAKGATPSPLAAARA